MTLTFCFSCGQVIRTLEEPTAAALAFGLHRKPNVNHILVYDLGGGTLDVSLLFVNDGSVEVLGSDGDDNLGGKADLVCLRMRSCQRITICKHTVGRGEAWYRGHRGLHMAHVPAK